jgi:hypothetical protein
MVLFRVCCEFVNKGLTSKLYFPFNFLIILNKRWHLEVGDVQDVLMWMYQHVDSGV